jgi:hypothetical protein
LHEDWFANMHTRAVLSFLVRRVYIIMSLTILATQSPIGEDDAGIPLHVVVPTKLEYVPVHGWISMHGVTV